MYKIFLLLFITSLNANLIITDKVQKYDNFTIQYLYDETSSLTIETIKKIDFTHNIPSQFTQGYKYGNAWFKLEFTNITENEDFVLYFTESIWSTLDLYEKQDALFKVTQNGLNIPLLQRDIQDSSPAFSLHIPSKETRIFYVKGNTIASQIGEFQLFTKKEFFNPHRMTIMDWYIIYAFVLFSFILLNIYNYFITKEVIYAYYIGYIFVYIVFSFMHSGVYIYFNFPNWQEGLHVLGTLTLFTLLQFSKEFLDLKNTYPRMKKIFNYLSLVALFIALLLSQNLPYATVASNVFFSLTLIFIIYVAMKVLKTGFDGAKYYLIALMFYLPSLTIMAMNFNTILPNTDITRYSFLFGAFVEIFFFTLILTNRYMSINKEKLFAQQALLKEQENNEQKLLLEIEKQTKDLKETNLYLKERTDELTLIKEQLTKEATTDMLSGLYNRRYFFEASQKSFYTAIRYKQELAVMMLDIDNFKAVNDNNGHIFGDKVIRSISNILKNALRTSDILARYGGEEFIILLPQTIQKDAMQLADRIRIEIQEKKIEAETTQIHQVTISIGLTQLNQEEDISVEELISRADKALYDAKDNGRNRVCIA